MNGAEGLALLIAGFVAPYLTQLVKRNNISGPWAAWLALGVSAVCAVIALALTGGLGDALADPTKFVEKAGAVFALSTVIYHTMPYSTPTAIK